MNDWHEQVDVWKKQRKDGKKEARMKGRDTERERERNTTSKPRVYEGKETKQRKEEWEAYIQA